MIKEFTVILTRSLQEKFSSLHLIIAVLGSLLLSSPAYCQAYAYADGYENGDSVTAYSYVTGYYNSSTHVYTSNLTLTSPTGRTSSSSTSGTSVSTSISLNFEDGVFSFSSSFVGTCPNPQGGGNHAVGGSGGQVVQAPFISITNVSVDKLSIPKDESAILTAQVSASIGASGGFTLGITENSHSSPAPVYIFGPPTKPGTVTGGGSATSVTFTISNGDGNSGIQKAKLDIYFTVVPTTTPPTVLKNSPTTSQEITFQ